MVRGRTAVAVGVATAIAYACWARPRLMRWGATNEEVAGPFPGAGLVPNGTRAATMGVTLDATPAQVWPWLVQLGWDRAGWYSWDRLDNAGRPSARAVHPEWQDLVVGDRLQYWVPLLGPQDSYEVRILEPNRFLGLYGLTDLRGRWLDPDRPRPPAYMEGLWGFSLRERPDGRTRLVISGYQAARPRWFERFLYGWVFPPMVWIMQARMVAVLRRNIERVAGDGVAQPGTTMPSARPSVHQSLLPML